ncbi:hypothetical protein ATO6_22630 [Oceanicola sp. 22II-s10i]|nr:hypothetical protein ATO6_22630 [Oceanicola sp. 22II-s10i]
MAAEFRGLSSGPPPEAPARTIESLSTRLSPQPAGTNVRLFSAENFYLCRPPRIELIRDCLGDQTRILCYLREPVSHLRSMWMQHIKRKRLPQSFQDYVESAQSHFASGMSYYDYDARMYLWRRYFPDVVEAIFEPMENALFLRKFLDLCGLGTVDSAGLAIRTPGNVALPDGCSSLLQRLNAMVAAGQLDTATRDFYVGCVRRNAKHFNDLFEPALSMAEYDFSDFMDLFRQHNPRLAPRFESSKTVLTFAELGGMTDGEILDIMASEHAKTEA